ncbi:C1 family peptidase [Variovorax sp. J22R24]|uniref:C1 family peptidase n=1 Tax=Variovorax gracilis TaxID=3053502 RepID=UPI0025776250|nr:C1 family peptidase [Variovorax sp. J22R24]MDM0106557.1 C1 family peptidase [Variovorax sp. J22R24]
MAVVDWRNRFNANWVASVRNQGGTVNCWAFSMAALYESMVRIEHGVWCRRSESDLGRATGKQGWDFGNPGEASIAAERFGVADPDCLAWSEAAILYTAKPHGAAMTAMPLSPTPDRAGRTVRIDVGAHTVIGSGLVSDKKKWLNLVGPMAFMCTLPTDFTGAPASGIFSTVTGGNGGVHAMLVVGFDDTDKCWIIKNSWGSGWGDAGFVQVAYGEGWLENTQWWGVRNTNPDPWTKRRQRNGVIIESGNGAAHQNSELFLQRGMSIVHDWQESGAGPWSVGGVVRSTDEWRGFGPDALDCPAAIQSSFNRNYELVYRSSLGNLRHIYYDQASKMWFDATLFGPLQPQGIPGFVQGNRGAPGDFEVVVMTRTGVVEHWTKHNGSPWTNPPGTWYKRATLTLAGTASGPALVSSRRNLTSELEQETGELHYVCAAANQLFHFAQLAPGGSWSQIAAFGLGRYTGPCMIETLNANGNELEAGPLQLFVEVGNQIEHWFLPAPSKWRPFPTWNRVTVFGTDVRRVIGALQGSSSNLEVYVQRTDGEYQAYVRVGVNWTAGPILP